MVLLHNDAYFAGGALAGDYAWLRFMARATGGTAVGIFGEVL